MKLTIVKVAALLQLGVAGLSYWSDGAATSAYVAGSLALFLFSNEVLNDERVENLKLKALRLGFALGLIVTMWLNLMGQMYKPPGLVLKLSAFDALNLILAIALVMFYFWRWQDGRKVSED